MFCYVWEFRVRPEHLDAFLAGYGPEGDWVRLFRRDPAYVETQLLRDREDPTRFLTIDVWRDREACRVFRQAVRADFDELDRRFEQFTISERHLGDFDGFGARMLSSSWSSLDSRSG